MVLRFSRHAKRRVQLYGIPKSTIEGILAEAELDEGKHELIQGVPGFRYPLKIVVTVEKDVTTIITAYPLKKGKKQ